MTSSSEKNDAVKTHPRVVMTLCVRDEADIIRSQLEYHLSMGVDLIVAMDNGSVDGTDKILREYEKAGKLEYFYEPSDEYLQDVWITRLASHAYLKHAADWIINGDADEFFVPKEGTLKDVLKGISSEVNAVSIKRHDMVPIERSGVSDPPIEMVYRKTQSLEWVMGHPLANKFIHRGMPGLQIQRGSHFISADTAIKQMESENIFTFHYPIRSYQQFENKVRNVGAGRARNNLPTSRYNHWCSALKNGELRNVFLSYQLNQEQIQKKLESKEIVEERKIADVLTKLL